MMIFIVFFVLFCRIRFIAKNKTSIFLVGSLIVGKGVQATVVDHFRKFQISQNNIL